MVVIQRQLERCYQSVESTLCLHSIRERDSRDTLYDEVSKKEKKASRVSFLYSTDFLLFDSELNSEFQSSAQDNIEWKKLQVNKINKKIYLSVKMKCIKFLLAGDLFGFLRQ